MTKPKLIEKLEDLATFLTLASNDAGKAKDRAKSIKNSLDSDYWRGREQAYKLAFDKLDGIIKEAKE